MPRCVHINRTIEATKVFDQFIQIKRFLWDEGPHTVADIAPVLGLGIARTQELLTLLRAEGVVEKFRRDGSFYWKLEDHVEL